MSTEGQSLELRRVPLRKRLAWGAMAGTFLALLAFGMSHFFWRMEAWTLDLRHQLLAAPTPAADKVAIIVIDEYSIREMLKREKVPFPWPRDVYEAFIAYLKEAGAKAIVFDILFVDPGQRKTDEAFANVVKEAGNVVLAAKLEVRPPDAEPGKLEHVKEAVDKAAVAMNEPWPFPAWGDVGVFLSPLPELTTAARGLGFVNVEPDPDNTIRRADLLQAALDPKAPLASLALAAARAALGTDASVRFNGRELLVGDAKIPLGDDGRPLVRYYGFPGTIRTENAYSVLASFTAIQEGKPPVVDPQVFKDRVVFLGINAAGREDIKATPMGDRFLGVERVATVCANILGGEFLRERSRAERFGLLLTMGLATGLVAFGVWKPLPSGLLVAGILGIELATALVVFPGGLFFEMFFPAFVAGGAYSVSVVTGYWTEGRQKREVSRAFGQYLSPVIIRDLLKHPESLKLGGETREIAVYFSDIAGFSTFSEAMTPTDLVSFLNVYLSSMTDAILDRGGVVDKYIGDAIMAFWGAPAPSSAPGRDACLAALEQRRRLAVLNERFRSEGRPIISFRAGISMGPATVGNMGSTRRFNYTAMGDVVNLASRLEGANKFFGTGVMITDSVKASAGDAVVARRLGRVQVVGKSIPTLVHEVICAPSDLRDGDRERLERYHEALALLEGGGAAEAARLFESLLSGAAGARDPLVELCFKKCREVEATGKAWDGVWVLTSKG